MYLQHFGLKQRLFRADIDAASIFVGPQNTAAMAAVRKALATDDAAIIVSGPVGVGKTALLRRALDSIGDQRIVISIGRLHLGHDEVIELLLAGLGADQLPAGIVQRFAMFRRMLHQHAEHDKRVFILVEDAARIGIGALAELEALTAEDSGAPNGASLILMGTDSIAELLRAPELTRLKQRVRLQQTIAPLNADEVTAYLQNCCQLAGAEFDSIFELGCSPILCRLSDGIPRVINTIVEQVLTAAAAEDQPKVTEELIERVAAGELGLVAAQSGSGTSPELENVQSNDATPKSPGSSSNWGGSAAAKADNEAAEVSGPETVQDENDNAHSVLGQHQAGTSGQSQDTLPDLRILAPSLVSTANSGDLESDDISSDTGSIPTLTTSMRLDSPSKETPAEPPPNLAVSPDAASENPAPLHDDSADEDKYSNPDTGGVLLKVEPTTVDSSARSAAIEPPEPRMPDIVQADEERADPDEVPEWERDPTLAQLRPDLEALEQAISAERVGTASDMEPVSKSPKVPANEPKAAVPEITLDRQIQAKIDEATEALRQTHFDIDTEDLSSQEPAVEGAQTDLNSVSTRARPKLVPLPEVTAEAVQVENSQQNPRTEKNRVSTVEALDLDQLSAKLSSAKSIEDVDDKLAETLFGEEFSMIAAAVRAKAVEAESANDDLQLDESEPEVASPGRIEEQGHHDNATGVAGEPKPNTQNGAANGMAGSAAERLATVRALNNGKIPVGAPPAPKAMESIVMSEDFPAGGLPSSARRPASIETQLNTSMTQTLKALDISSAEFTDTQTGQHKGGFFSRFRRS
jgi:general secretion pathway protein A